MMHKARAQIKGHWLAGPNAGHAGTLWDVRAGLVYGALSDKTTAFGDPCDFRALSGENGEALLEILLPRPAASHLFKGAVRESLASVYSNAMLGCQGTRAWEQPYRYIVDDGEGNAAALQLNESGIVGAMCCHHPSRHCRLDMAAVPEDQRPALVSLLRLPFLSGSVPPINALFWTELGRLSSPEPWHRTYLFGGEVFRRELIDSKTWQDEATEFYGLVPAVTSAIIAVSERAMPLREIPITRDEIALLLPSSATYRNEAREQLLDGGVFRAETSL